MSYLKNIAIAVILIITTSCAYGQFILSGRVLDKENGEPLPFANIYVDKSQIGSTTNSIGEYELKIPYKMTIDVFVSFVGYKTARRTVVMNRDQSIDFFLDQSDIVMQEKIISIDKDKQWQKNLKKFMKGFIGTGEIAKMCEIENPWVLEFDREGTDLVASSGDQVLILTNRALGYKISYLLEKFRMGSSLTSYIGLAGFEDLKASGPDEKESWINRRNKSYNGSLRHFFKSVRTDSLKENGFMVFKKGKRAYEAYNFEEKNFPVSGKELYSNELLAFTGFLEVVYVNELTGGSSQNTILEILQKSRIMPNGELSNPYAVIARGNMGMEMAAYMLPMEFDEPQQFDEGLEFYNNIVIPFQNYQSVHPYEMIHLHTDRTLYFPGENIWLKGYLNRGGKPSDLSSKLFVRLQSGDSVVTSVIIRVKDGLASGYVTIPDSIQSGSYTLNAYSDWSKDSSDKLQYNKLLTIGGSDSGILSDEVTTETFSIRVFPEGGHFISGYLNTFAFELKDSEGIPIKGEIELLEDGEVVEKLPTVWQGKGKGAIRLSAKKEYSVQLAGKPESRMALDISKNVFVNLTVHQQDDRLKVRLQKDKKQSSTYYLITVAEDKIGEVRMLNLEKELEADITGDVLKPGVNRLIIMDRNYRPVAERLVFIQPDQINKNPGFTLYNDRYAKRSLVNLEVKLADSIRSASLAVVDMLQADENGGDNILITHYLRPDLTGMITGFETMKDFDDPKKMDLLMLTNGWSRYNWDKDLMDDSKMRDYELEKGLEISGRVFTSKKKTLVENPLVVLYSAGTGLMTIPGDSTGHFKVRNIDFTDSTTLLFKIEGEKKKKEYIIDLDQTSWNTNPASQEIAVYQSQVVDPVKNENYIRRNKIAEMYDFDGKTYYLKDAVISDTKLDVQKESIYSSAFSEKIIVDSTVVRRTPFTLDLLNRNFTKVTAGMRQSMRTLAIYPYVKVANQTPAILVDGVEVSVFELREMNVDNIESVEVTTSGPAALLGRYGILIETKKNITGAVKVAPKDFIAKKLKGFQEYKEFYHHDYSVPQEGFVPDNRTTLFWEPMITSDNRNIRFYNHDNPGLIKVIMEGFTLEGSPFRQVSFYELSDTP